MSFLLRGLAPGDLGFFWGYGIAAELTPARLLARTAHERLFAAVFEAHLDRCQLTYGRAVTVGGKTCAAANLFAGLALNSPPGYFRADFASAPAELVGSYVRIPGQDRKVTAVDATQPTTGVLFDGSTDYYSKASDFTGNADGKRGTFSCWFRVDGGAGTRRIMYASDDGPDEYFRVELATDNTLRVIGLGYLALQTTQTFAVETAWHHVLASWNLALGPSSARLRIDGVSDCQVNDYTNSTLDYTVPNHRVGAGLGATNKWVGCLAEVYLNYAQYVDADNPGVLAAFYAGADRPTPMGADGSLPTSSVPILYLRGLVADFATNRGSGGGMTENGTPADSDDPLELPGTATVANVWNPTPSEGDAFSFHDAEGAIVADRMCYNTFPNCQDQNNYNPTAKIWKFGTRGMPLPPGQTIRPYLLGTPAAAAAEIDISGKLSPRSRVQLELTDEVIADGELDPYLAFRQAPAEGTWMARFLVRNPHFFGRRGKLRKGFVVDPWDWATFINELFIIESMSGAGANGNTTVVLKDPLKLADRQQLPAATNGRLNTGISDVDLSLTLESGQGSLYRDPAVTGEQEFICIGDEVIRYTAISTDTLSWPNTTYRAQFGTTADSHAAEDTVQQAMSFVDKTWAYVIQYVLNAIGISDGNIDLSLLAQEQTNWWGSQNITWCVPKPRPANEIIEELLIGGGALNWWHPTEQKVKIKVDVPPDIDLLIAGVPVFSDGAELMKNSVARQTLEDLRINQSTMNVYPLSATADLRKATNYLRGQTVIDGSAQGPNEYGDVRSEINYSPWLTSVAVAQSLASRRVAYRRDAPIKLKFQIDPKDYDVTIGDVIDVQTSKLPGFSGAPRLTRMRITKWHDRGTHLDAEAVSTTFNKRYAFINDDASPDYISAGEIYRARAFICGADGLMSNGDPGYLIQ